MILAIKNMSRVIGVLTLFENETVSHQSEIPLASNNTFWILNYARVLIGLSSRCKHAIHDSSRGYRQLRYKRAAQLTVEFSPRLGCRGPWLMTPSVSKPSKNKEL